MRKSARNTRKRADAIGLAAPEALSPLFPLFPGTGTGTGTGIGTGTGMGLGMGTGLGTGLGTGTGMGLGTGLGIGLGTGLGMGLGTGLGTGFGTGFGTGLGMGFGIGLGTGFGLGTGTSTLRIVAEAPLDGEGTGELVTEFAWFTSLREANERRPTERESAHTLFVPSGLEANSPALTHSTLPALSTTTTP